MARPSALTRRGHIPRLACRRRGLKNYFAASDHYILLDDNRPRADNPIRIMVGATKMQWFHQALNDAHRQGITWKIAAVSSPIDETGPIGGSFTVTNGVNNGPGTFSIAETDGGKSWIGGYRPERNQLFRFIADTFPQPAANSAVRRIRASRSMRTRGTLAWIL